MAASVELARQGYKPVILERSRLGGLLGNANLVENYPGFPQGIAGVDLVERFAEQVRRHDIEIMYEEVISLDYEDGSFCARTSRRELHSQAVIVATGTMPLTIKDLGAEDVTRGRILHEIFPIRDVTDKKIAVVGAGDVAFDYALSLASGNEVVILNRDSEAKCCPGLLRMVEASQSITHKTNTSITPPVRSHQQGILLKCRNATGEREIYADYVVVAIGRTGNDKALLGKLEASRQWLESKGLLQFAGDIRNVDYRQTGIAVGSGIMAAMRVVQALEGIS